MAGCSDFENKQRSEYFIKVGDRTITVADFNKAFEIAKNAYPENRIQRPDAVREARFRLVRQMTEEMILLERAEELGITITDSQIEKALRDIKKDYPDNVFEEILLEYAITYPSWKEGLKTRLLMEKVITQELGHKIEITHDDISKYYEEHFKDDSTSPDVKAVSKDINDIIIKILRKEKMEKAYASWIKKLKNKYAVEINKKELEKMTGL
ncbi:MAG: SurA N-terminal domain-containing protein [Deltaproteobacteria bacterium]|nr:SurA N-terminal domain-containing protein [Deltaproteobacteria bacterium]